MQTTVKTGALQVALSAICASLAVYMTLANLVFPFPILPYLRFEVAEIPVLVAFFAMGPIMGLSTSVIYWAVLNVFGEWVPIGPAMKLAAIAPTILGLWLGTYSADKLLHRRTESLASKTLAIASGIVFRVIVTTLLNIVVLVYLMPSFLDFATGCLSATLGLNPSSEVSALFWTLVFTALFNVIHFFISLIPSYAIVKSLKLAGIPGLRDIWAYRSNTPDRAR